MKIKVPNIDDLLLLTLIFGEHVTHFFDGSDIHVTHFFDGSDIEDDVLDNEEPDEFFEEDEDEDEDEEDEYLAPAEEDEDEEDEDCDD